MIAWLLSLPGPSQPPQWIAFWGYISVRSMGALVFAFLLSILFGGRVIAALARLKAGQPIRDDRGAGAISLKDMHASKADTPTMGGLLMIGSMLGAMAVFGDWRQPLLWLACMMAFGYALIGFLDDYRKVRMKDSGGLAAKHKLALQACLAVAFATIYAFALDHKATYEFHQGGAASANAVVILPFVKEWAVGLGIFYIPFAVVVLAGTSNAVNLTDGLDGLAAGVAISATACFGFVAYMAGRADMSAYLLIPHVRGAGELTVMLSALVGSCLGFLWFNAYPARVFMGDTGSMMIGGLLGSVALMVKHEYLLLVAGGIFVAEALSVIIQVSSWKLRGRRVFLMSPLHHHFERQGVPESHIIVRFWIVGVLLALAALGMLKLR